MNQASTDMLRSRAWQNGVAGCLVAFLLAACATHKDKLLPHGDKTMMDVWMQNTGAVRSGASRELLDARQALRRPLADVDAESIAIQNASYTRTAENEIDRQFQRLPDPDLLMYVFPHLTGTEPVPVPGYSTVFPLYQRVQYALPGERTEDY